MLFWAEAEQEAAGVLVSGLRRLEPLCSSVELGFPALVSSTPDHGDILWERFLFPPSLDVLTPND